MEMPEHGLKIQNVVRKYRKVKEKIELPEVAQSALKEILLKPSEQSKNLGGLFYVEELTSGT